MAQLIGFPNPVDEVSARLVAGGVVALCAATLATRQPLLLLPLSYGFVARVLTGPKLSPLGLLVTRVVRPRLAVAARPVDGPPKRFAQGIGATLSVAAAVAGLGFGAQGAAWLLVGAILVAASLESGLGFCLGCKVFGVFIAIGIVPATVCAECADLSLRRGRVSAG